MSKTGTLILLMAAATGAGGGLPLRAHAHELRHDVQTSRSALVLQVTTSDGTPFSFESYEIFGPGGQTPLQVGRTDHAGRIAFLPEGPGKWRVRVFSEDGHGLDREIENSADATATAIPLETMSGNALTGRWARLAAGIGYVFGIFGMLSLFRRKLRRGQDHAHS